MNNFETPRREFLQSTGAAFGGAWLALQLPEIHAAADYARRLAGTQQAFENLSAQEADDLAAIAEQIFPTTDTPGAREAGVIYFVDRALGTFAAGMAGFVRGGLGELNASVAEEHPPVTRFGDLDFDRQTEMLRSVESTPFFEAIRYLTIAGMFSQPSYGGNRDRVGWELLGFEDQPSFQPPFGYYDARYTDGQREEDR